MKIESINDEEPDDNPTIDFIFLLIEVCIIIGLFIGNAVAHIMRIVS